MHFKLTSETQMLSGRKLHRIEATIDFYNQGSLIKAGTKGGFIEKEANLSGYAWVSHNALVTDNAWVTGDAWVSDKARVAGDARVKSQTDWCYFVGFGSSNRTTTAFKCKVGVKVVCGCFIGTLAEFKDRVERVHGNNEYGLQYQLVIKLIEQKLK